MGRLEPLRLADAGLFVALMLHIGGRRDGRHRPRLSLGVDGHKGEIGPRRMHPISCGRHLTLHTDANLHGAAPGIVHLGRKANHVAHLDGGVEVELVHGGRHHPTARMALRSDGGADVDPGHQRAAEHGANRVGVRGQDQLGHGDARVGGRARGEIGRSGRGHGFPGGDV